MKLNRISKTGVILIFKTGEAYIFNDELMAIKYKDKTVILKGTHERECRTYLRKHYKNPVSVCSEELETYLKLLMKEDLL